MPTKEMVRLDLPHLLTPLPGPRATELIRRDSEVLSPSYTRCYPLVAAQGEGAMIEDVDGNRFLDFNAGIAVASTGHCHPKVVEAIEEQSKRLIHMSGTDFYYENMVQLAEKLASIAPGGGPHRVYFGNSGAAQAPLLGIGQYLESGALVEIIPDFRRRALAVSLVVAHRSNLSRRVRAFMKWIEEVLTPYLE